MATPESRTHFFDDVVQGLTDQRGRVYGPPLINFARITLVDAVLAQCPDQEVRHALRMIWVNCCRLVETPDHDDSIHDIAGYARTIAMIHDERDRRKQQPGTKAVFD